MSADAIALSVVSHAQSWLVNQLLSDLAKFHPAGLSIIVTQNVPDRDSLAERLGAEVVTNQGPLGFGANHNAAFRRCNAPYFCVVNPDIRLLFGAARPDYPADAGPARGRLGCRHVHAVSQRCVPRSGHSCRQHHPVPHAPVQVGPFSAVRLDFVDNSRSNACFVQSLNAAEES